MHTDKATITIDRRCIGMIFIQLVDLALTHFIRAFDLFNEGPICIHTVALLKDDGTDLGQRLLQALSLNPKLRATKFDIITISSTPSFEL